MAEAIQYTFISIGEMSMAIFAALSQLITRFSETVTQLSGPVGIYQVTSQVTETGQITYILNLLSLLSVNVGIFNLLPIPALDGCQVIFAIVEKIIGRELPEKSKGCFAVMWFRTCHVVNDFCHVSRYFKNISIKGISIPF